MVSGGARIVRVGLVALVFGMDWLPLVGGRPDRLARRLARQHRASHAVLSGSDRAAVGLARLARGQGPAQPYSGAQIFALLNPRGTIAAILELDDGGLCVLAAHEGAVLSRSDRIYHDPTPARAVIDELRLAYPRLRDLSLPGSGGRGVRLEDLIRHASDEARLWRTPWRGWRHAGLVGLVVCAATPFIWQGLADARDGPQPIDAREAWARSQRLLLDRHRVHGPVGTRTLLTALYRQPAVLAGWRLRLLSCRLADDGLWRCLGEYERADRRADNRGLLRRAPQDWHLDFPSLDLARASWTLTVPAQAPDRAQPPSVEGQARDWASQAQAILPAFAAFRLDARRSLEPAAPRDPGGAELPRPADLRRYALRELRIDGPLRSAALLIPISRHIGWRKAALSIIRQTVPGVSASPMNLHLEGALYETQDSPASSG
ncbi:hypothetical protein [Castellaniella sp. GW247-6E4]|uniref:hypothetical protein n=1 Tax=Castellaniella sp. GW247-6E4 TaxID=3140380 RepID=UPI0033149474